MEIRKLEDGCIELFGYVNITERNSKLINENGVRFREQIKKGAWKRAIERNNDIKLLLNHSWDYIYGSTKYNLRLYEDNIGARFSIKTHDETLAKHAENGDFKGLSFAFRCNDDEYLDDKGYKLRIVKDMDVSEVSLLTVEPAYDGCIVETREKDGNVLETRDYKLELEETEEELGEEVTDFSIVEKEIEILKLKAI